MSQVKAIAIFHGLGDCINATSLLKPLRAKYPKSQIVWISSEKYLHIVEHNPIIDQKIAIPGNPYKADLKYGELKKKYKGLIMPAPCLNPTAKDNTLLGSFGERVKKISGKSEPLEPLLYMASKEADCVDNWLKKNNIGKYVMMETNFTSSQSFWDKGYTKMALKELNKKGYTVLLTHRSDQSMEEYEKLCRVFCLDFGYRMMPRFYNKASGFIGVSSGISCIVHTHQCSKKIPHLEFVRGEHWCTRSYPKKNKTISFNKNVESVRKLIRTKIPD